ncbi:ATP-binding cassette domain-containing protein [Virgibacillus sp. C22-A2]|uniref:ATP-binding cassette domain-containing protein n=1 Tax=Virgibacillus tibetensis TaxID=3042313 RepID=A0ABU6KJF7_9BACI|nr:ATP-binding cassette domain-containing protein [Virgibacillus sp. C22-A2]
MEALKNLSLEVPIGSKVALLGPNVAGKSTLLHHLNGLKIPNEGSVKIIGSSLTKKLLPPFVTKWA